MIAVHWEEVDCINTNEVITGYIVQYGRESAEGERTVERVLVTEASINITGLIPSTVYTIQMAAVNSAGTGVYSDVINVPTEGRLTTTSHSSLHGVSLCMMCI